MITRYSRSEMVSIWSPQTKYRIWFEIEAHACDALAELGIIPKEAAKIIWEKGTAAEFDINRINEIEAITKHDVIAFLTHLAEFVGSEARFIHQGMTSSDVLDTTLNIQLMRASDLLLKDIDQLLEALKNVLLNIKRPLPLVEVMAFMLNQQHLGLNLLLHTLNFPVVANASLQHAKKFPPVLFQELSELLLILIRVLKNM